MNTSSPFDSDVVVLKPVVKVVILASPAIEAVGEPVNSVDERTGQGGDAPTVPDMAKV